MCLSLWTVIAWTVVMLSAGTCLGYLFAGWFHPVTTMNHSVRT